MCSTQCLLFKCELGIVSQDKGTHNGGGKGTKEHSHHSQSAVRMAGRRKSAGVVAGNRQYTYWRSMTQSHPIVTPHNDHVPVGGMSHILPPINRVWWGWSACVVHCQTKHNPSHTPACCCTLAGVKTKRWYQTQPREQDKVGVYEHAVPLNQTNKTQNAILTNLCGCCADSWARVVHCWSQ